MPGNAESIIDYDCVPTYSQTLAAQIINMNDNVIVSQTSLKSGTIPENIFYSHGLHRYLRGKSLLKIQSHKENHYSLKKHPNGYFYILKNETLANNKIEVLKARCKQDILRLKNGLKGGSHGQWNALNWK